MKASAAPRVPVVTFRVTSEAAMRACAARSVSASCLVLFVSFGVFMVYVSLWESKGKEAK